MSRREAAAILSLLLLPAGVMSAERMTGGSVMLARGVEADEFTAGSPDAFAAFLKTDREEYARIVSAIGLAKR